MTLDSLPVLILNPHSRCNCRCRMCDIWKTTDSYELSASELHRQMESIENLGVQWVVLSGGEPMMHSDLWALCSMLRGARQNPRITLLSSGLLLQRHAENIVRHVDDVIVSLDGPAAIHDRIRGVSGAFQLLAAGVERLRCLRPDFPVSARCTVQRANCASLNATVDASLALHLNSISFLAADLDSAAFNRPRAWPQEKQREIALDPADLAILEAEIDELASRKLCGGLVVESVEKLRRIARHFRVHLQEAAPVAPRCNAPWTSAVLEADGSVRPCFFHPAVGNVHSGLTLPQILNGPQATAFRDSLNVAENPVCRRCVCSLHWKGSCNHPNLTRQNSPHPTSIRNGEPGS